MERFLAMIGSATYGPTTREQIDRVPGDEFCAFADEERKQQSVLKLGELTRHYHRSRVLSCYLTPNASVRAESPDVLNR